MNATSEPGNGPTVPTDQPADPRWRRFAKGSWRCASCGLPHTGLFELECDSPEFWSGSPDKGPNAGILTADQILTEDFCIIDGEHYFVRCVLALPLIGWSGEAFGFGVWVMLSTRSFALYRDTFDSGRQGLLGPWFGRIANRLEGYADTLNLKCHVQPQEGRQRPLVRLEATDHPLAVEQQTGITFDRLLELYALNGHDLSAALASG